MADFEILDSFYLEEIEVEDASFTKKLVDFLGPLYKPVYFLAEVIPCVLFFILFVLTFFCIITAVMFPGFVDNVKLDGCIIP